MSLAEEESQNAKWKTENNGRRETATRLPRIVSSLASQTMARHTSAKKGKGMVNWTRLVYTVHQTLLFFERFVVKTNTGRLIESACTTSSSSTMSHV